MSWRAKAPPKAQQLVPALAWDLPPSGLLPVPGADTYTMASSVCDCCFVFWKRRKEKTHQSYSTSPVAPTRH